MKKFLRNAETKNDILDINSKDGPQDIVEELNNFFCEVGPNLASKIPNSNLVVEFNQMPNIDDFTLHDSSIEDVEKLLLKIPDSKATGDDGIPVRLLKLASHTCSIIICHIINMSIKHNVVPIEWKCAVVTLLYKDGDRSVASNYRPISILPALSKILERVVYTQMYNHIDRNKILSNAQFGFRKGHSMSTCILSLLNKIYKNIEKKEVTGMVFLDLKKAFDMVDHNILLSKLRKYGVTDHSNNWFKSYSTGRFQCVRHRGVKSNRKEVVCGVPQGSILGPLLFIIYINDLSEYLTECDVSLYADDTALFSSSISQIDLMMKLKMELSTISEWLKLNKLTLNVNKTKYVIFGTRNQVQAQINYKLDVNGQELERVQHMKYLGVILDSQLTFDEHVNFIHSKAVKKLGIVRKSREFLDRKTSLTLYRSSVLPHLDYCDLIYENTSKTNLNKLQLVQNSACRIMLLADKRTSVSQMHKDLNLLPLDKCRDLHRAQDCFKHINDKTSSLSYMFIEKDSARPTRHGQTKQVHCPDLRTNYGHKAYSYRGPNFWNGLPNHIRLVTQKNEFRDTMTRLLMLDENHPG